MTGKPVVPHEITDAANCTDACVFVSERLALERQTRYWHVHPTHSRPGPEALFLVDDSDLYKGEGEVRRCFVERLKADHRYWEEGLGAGLDLTEDEEERERARLQPIPPPRRSGAL